MIVFYHALANLPTKKNIDRIYLELVTENLKAVKRSGKIQSTPEIGYSPNIVLRTGSVQIGETPHVYFIVSRCQR